MLTVDGTADPLKIIGEVDMSSAPLLIEAVLLSRSPGIDLSGITFMDSTGLHALIDLVKARPSLRIVAVSKPVRRLIQIAGLADHLGVDINA